MCTTHVSVWMCICMCAYVRVYVCMHAFRGMCALVCDIHVHVYVLMCMHVSIYVDVECACMHVRACLSMGVDEGVCAYV